ncbi:PrgI family protein [Candidatus Kaiserbacteria bacterium]|nr:PrgI family protein [Candidatus Kaiserbacteria bacterium]
MEYQVPQFIEVEDKIVGPLTLKQFIYLAGGGGLCIVFFVYLHLILALLFSAPIVALAVALAFYKKNGKPFVEIVEAGFNYYVTGKLFLWKHEEPTAKENSAAAAAAAAQESASRAKNPRLTRGKLTELAWALDVKALGGTPQSREQ